MHMNAVTGNVSILDLSQLAYLLQIGDGSSLELRDLVVRNYAQPTLGSGAKEYAYVPGLLSWPTITAQPGGTLRLNNTTQVQLMSIYHFRVCNCLHAVSLTIYVLVSVITGVYATLSLSLCVSPEVFLLRSDRSIQLYPQLLRL